MEMVAGLIVPLKGSTLPRLWWLIWEAKNVSFGALFEQFLNCIPLAINKFLRKHYRKFFLKFAACLDAAMKLKIAAIVNRAGTKSAAVLSLTTLVCLFGCTACAQLKSWFTQPGAVERLAPAGTNVVTIVTTNTIAIPPQTNSATGEVTPGSVQYQLSTNVTTVVQPPVYFTNLALVPAVSTSIQTADTAASAAGVPWSHTAAEVILAAIGGLLSWTNLQNRQKLLTEVSNHANTQSALSQAQDVAQTLVQNFEQLRQVALTVPGYTRQIDDKVMTAIQVAQQLAGVKDQINALVDEHTNTTLPGN
jgi:cell fate (sporulation/competence/biofilm development) regulator YlbF (YheA/YmcA/DUF963 family)